MTRLPDAPWRRRPGLDALLDALDAGGGATRFVGGAVRDTLLGLSVSDVDVATRLPAPDVLDRLAAARIKAVPTGLAHGTVTAVVAGVPIEVTTLRRDVATDGRRATIAYTDDWREDAARRDFTINALYADPADGAVHDYFGGLDDLAARRVRFIGDPLTRIAEDHLRILRLFRFHARFGEGAPDAAALTAARARANDLMALSRERIADELLKLLALPDPSPTVALMRESGIFAPVLPEIGVDGVAALARLPAREVEGGAAPDPVRRLAALLPPDPAVAEGVTHRLRLSKRALRRLVDAARRAPGDVGDPAALAYRLGTEAAVDRLLLGEGPAAEAARLAGWEKPRLPIGGGDLVALGLHRGPRVAALLAALERGWVEDGFREDRAALMERARRAIGQAERSSQ